MKTATQGNMLAAISFILWGILPLYYQYLPNADTNELLALRIIFTIPFMYLFAWILRRHIAPIKQIMADKKSLLFCLIAGLVMSVSWYTFTWAMTHGQVLAASLGYFINPLFAITLAVVFLKEKLSLAQKAAVFLGIIGISYQVYQYGSLPWISLIMGSFFAIYGLLKKHIKYDSFTSVMVESAVLLPFAVIYFAWLWLNGDSHALNGSTTELLLYIGSAPVTILPLIFFALAIQRTSLTMVGLMQYIEPSLQFLLAVFLFSEIFDTTKAISFSMIWLGLILCSIESMPRRKAKHVHA